MYNNTPSTNQNTTIGTPFSMNNSNILTPSMYNFTPNSNMNYSIESPLGMLQSPYNSMYPNSPLITNSNISNPNDNINKGGFAFFSVNQGNSIENDESILDKMLSKKNKNKKINKARTVNIKDDYPNQYNFKIENNNIPYNANNCLFPQRTSSQKQIPFINNGIINNNITYQYTFNTINYSPSEDDRNKIKIEEILEGKDKRTTLMIKNIPNKYTISTFLDEINGEFINKYDIFYLPIDYGNKCNLGFAFINFVEPLHIIDFYETYRGKKWKRFNSEKICELVYAKIQGKRELVSHFEKGKVLSFNSEDKRPLILPTPNPLPKIKLPIKLLETFIKTYPYASYTIEHNSDNIVDNNKESKFIVETLFSF